MRLGPSGADLRPADFLPYLEKSWEGGALCSDRRGRGSWGRTQGARSARLPPTARRGRGRLHRSAFRSTIWAMQVATGTVVDGKIVLEGVSLTEGAVVAVVTRGADESFSLTEAQEDELLAAMAEIERGEYVTLEELLQSLPKHG